MNESAKEALHRMDARYVIKCPTTMSSAKEKKKKKKGTDYRNVSDILIQYTNVISSNLCIRKILREKNKKIPNKQQPKLNHNRIRYY